MSTHLTTHNTYIITKLSVQSPLSGHHHHNFHYSRLLNVSKNMKLLLSATAGKHTVGAIIYTDSILSIYILFTTTAAMTSTIIIRNTIIYVIILINGFQANNVNTMNPKIADPINDKNIMSILYIIDPMN